MLIRLVSHPKDNSDHIDKLIYIEGLPESMIYRVKDGKRFLLEPWQPDVENNVPDRIQRVFFKNPVTVWFELSADPTFQGQKACEYSREINYVKIDYQTRQGEEMWKRIEKILDRETPRDMEVPEPAVVGDRLNWTLEPADVPSVVLERREKDSPAVKTAPVIDIPVKKDEEKDAVQLFRCPDCIKEFPTSKGLFIHGIRKHKNKEAVGA